MLRFRGPWAYKVCKVRSLLFFLRATWWAYKVCKVFKVRFMLCFFVQGPCGLIKYVMQSLFSDTVPRPLEAYKGL